MSHKLNVNTAKYIVGLTAMSTVYTSLMLRRKVMRQLDEEGQLPVTLPPDMPGHFTRALRSKVAVRIREDAELSGMWLAWYGQSSSVMQLEGSVRSLQATHLTGNGMMPAGAPAFEVRREESGELLGTGTASFLPRGFWRVRRPCRIHGYLEPDDEKSAEIAVLTVDVQLFTWLPWLRVPLRRIPEQTYIPRDSEGFVRGLGLSEAVCAVTQPLAA